MADREGTRASAEFICTSIVPDVCKSPNIPVPYNILSLFNCAINFSPNVNFRKQPVFRHDSRLTTVRCDEPGVGGGVLSGVNMGWCRPIDGTASTTVRVNGSFVDYHVGTYMYMNCAGPEGAWNTIGQVKFLGNMLPGPVSSSGKIPKSNSPWCGGALSKLKDSVGDVSDFVKIGKQLYALSKTDWSDPSSVLGAIGGVAGLAGLNEVAEMAAKVKKYYDTAQKVIHTDWSDPKQALAAVAGVAAVAGMEDAEKAVGLAGHVADVIQTDWQNPQSAFQAASNILRQTGLNEMIAAMASNAISEIHTPVPVSGTIPELFPKPGAVHHGNTAAVAVGAESIPVSPDGKPRQPATAELVKQIRKTNPVAAARYDLLSPEDKMRVFVERGASPGVMGDETTAIYIPREGFSTSKAERDALPNVSDWIPGRIREMFVASSKDAREGNFFGIKEKEGNVYLFGGLIDLGSPEMPGAGNHITWWIPDRIFNIDMSPYFDYHDKNYYGSDVRLSDIQRIMEHELKSFRAGAGMNPLQLPLQAIYSTATTIVGLGTATANTAKDVGTGVFDSLGDFYDSCLSDSPKTASIADPKNAVISGCFEMKGPASENSSQTSPTRAGGANGSGSGGGGAAGGAASGTPTPPGPVTASTTAGGSANGGAARDGVLITTAAGSPGAAAAAIEAEFKADNAAALKDAQEKEAAEKAAEEKAAEEKAAEEKAAEEKAAEEKAAEEKAAEEKAAEEKAAEEKAVEEKAAEEKAAEEKAVEEKAAEENRTLCINSNVAEGDGDPVFIDGHANISVHNPDGTTVTHGLWPDEQEDIQEAGLANGDGSDIRTNFPEDDLNDYDYSYCEEITDAQYAELQQIIHDGATWRWTNNCSSFASETFYEITGTDVDADDILGFETPREVGQHIQELNNGANSNRASPNAPRPQNNSSRLP